MRRCMFFSLMLLVLATTPIFAAESAQTAPVKVLLFTGGGYHDYNKLVPLLTNRLAELVHTTFDVKWDAEPLRNARFADGYDAILYDLCFDKIDDALLDNALLATRTGKPTVMIHCAVHAFRHTARISEWETCCGMRSKVHDRYGPFTVTKVNSENPITKFFPNEWRTEGDELYQTISIDPKSVQLLKAKSPQDGREHVVCWTSQYGSGRVFATTLGHDLKTATTREYIQLVANGLLWTLGKIEQDGSPSPGAGAKKAK